MSDRYAQVCGKCGATYDKHVLPHCFDPVPPEIYRMRAKAAADYVGLLGTSRKPVSPETMQAVKDMAKRASGKS